MVDSEPTFGRVGLNAGVEVLVFSPFNNEAQRFNNSFPGVKICPPVLKRFEKFKECVKFYNFKTYRLTISKGTAKSWRN